MQLYLILISQPCRQCNLFPKTPLLQHQPTLYYLVKDPSLLYPHFAFFVFPCTKFLYNLQYQILVKPLHLQCIDPSGINIADDLPAPISLRRPVDNTNTQPMLTRGKAGTFRLMALNITLLLPILNSVKEAFKVPEWTEAIYKKCSNEKL